MNDEIMVEEKVLKEDAQVSSDELFDKALERVTQEVSNETYNAPERDEAEDTEEEIAKDEENSEEVVKEGEQQETEEEQPVSAEQTLKDEIKHLKNVILRQSGHTSKLQLDLNDVTAKAKVVRMPTTPLIDPETGLFGDGFKDLKSEFPDANFDQIENVIKSQQEQIQHLSNAVQHTNNNIYASQQQQHINKQVQAVNAAHPDIMQTVASDEFKSWQGSLPPDTQQMIASTNDAGQIDVIMGAFKSATGYMSESEKTAVSQAKAQQTLDSRKGRDKSSLSVGGKTQAVAVNGGKTFDEDALFKSTLKKLGAT